jgi:threonine/homoserine/homoserine lactone efflux protein
MDSVLLGAFVFFAISASVTPGPNNILMMASGANFGFRKTLPHLLGVVIGFPLMLLLIGLGFGAVLQSYPLVHEIIRYVGATYMLWMAWKIASTSKKIDDAKKPAKPMTFLQAVLFQWVNPKGWTMGVGAMAAYTTPGGNYFHELLVIILVFMLVGIPSALLWVMGGKFTATLLGSPKHFLIFNRVMGGLLALSVIPILFH